MNKKKLKKAAVIAITPHGLAVGRKIRGNLDCDFYLPVGIINETNILPDNTKADKNNPPTPPFSKGGIKGGFTDDSHNEVVRYETTTKELVNNIWGKYDSIIFIMAMGIVNRIIKDHIKDKLTDPAVVVVDELGRYAISALSGHEGGANRLAERIALICRGDFVVTTGSEATKTLIVGMGCRRGVSAERLKAALEEGLKMIGRTLDEVRLIASVEDKRDEEGLLEMSEEFGIPLKFISKELISSVEDNFERSEFVKKTIGVSAVAEPCAMLGGFRCQLLLKKTKMDGITVAIAEERFL